MMLSMRTTVTLDPDVAAKLKEEMHKKDISFKEALNSSIRRGLDSGERTRGKPYKVRTAKMEGAHGQDGRAAGCESRQGPAAGR